MIEIPVSPNLFDFQAGIRWVVAWHGAFTVLGVVTAVYLVARWGPTRGISSDLIYSTALWAVIGGFIGARLVHVIDHWGFYSDNPDQIIFIWQGGIGVWGGIIGGFLGGVAYVAIAKVPRYQLPGFGGEELGGGDSVRVPTRAWRIMMDLTAPALLLAQTIGRLGDIANGEHCAKAAGHFLSMTWTHPDSLARLCSSGYSPQPPPGGEPVILTSPGAEPVILYEIIWNLIVIAVLWAVRGRLKPDGMLFALYISLYAVGRFAISFAREDRVWAAGMQEAHFIALIVLAVAVPLLVLKARWVDRATGIEEVEAPPKPRGTRAARRRRQRRG